VIVIAALVEPEETVMLNVPVVAPAGIVVVAGTTASPLEDFRATDRPPVGAA